MNLPLVNIHNKKRILYLFLRDKEGTLRVRKVTDFYPYYYEPSNNSNGKYLSYNGEKLKKIIVNEPGEVPSLRSENSWESDIIYTQRYIIDRIDKFEKCPIKYAFIDIEILSKEFPEPNKAEYPIACITLYNSKYNKIRSWFLGDYEGKHLVEKSIKLMKDFITYLKKAKFDLLIGWNFVNFDYVYLFNFFSHLPQKYFFDNENKYNNFATAISPIKMVRSGENDIFYPAGTSIIDFLSWAKKIKKGLKSYSLDNFALEVLGKSSKIKDVNFTTINDKIKERCIEDVKMMIEIENKLHLIDYYDEIRRFAKTTWEDVYWNSKVIDALILQEAKEKKVILPKKSYNKEETFKGAYRRGETGLFESIFSADLASAYPSMLIDFNLSPENIIEKTSVNFPVIEVNDTLFQQNSDAILPSLAKKMIAIKSKLKKEKKENPDLQMKYDAVKGLVNSLFGVTAYKNFRIFEVKIASSITFLVRDLLHYLEEKFPYKIIYIDTDAIKYLADSDKIELLNELVKKWSKEKYNVTTNVEFESEGKIDKLLILGMCHYYAIKGNKKEIRGIEAKRSSSTIYEAKFQEALINKILDKNSREEIIKWIKEKIGNFKTNNLLEIAFPAKLAKKIEDYQTYLIRKQKDGTTKQFDKKLPIHIRALQNTQKRFPNFIKQIAELYYWVYTNTEEKIVAFDEELLKSYKPNVNWKLMIERNILNKTEKIFKAMNWNLGDLISEKPKIRQKRGRKSKNVPKSCIEEPTINDNKKDKGLPIPEQKTVKIEPYYEE